MVEEKSADPDWEPFRSKLLLAKSVHKGKETNGPRYAVYDFEYDAPGGEGKRYEGFWVCGCGWVLTSAAGTSLLLSRGLRMRAQVSTYVTTKPMESTDLMIR